MPDQSRYTSGTGYGAAAPGAEGVVSVISADQWMIDVLSDLEEAARDRDMVIAAERLASCRRVVQDEIGRKRLERMEVQKRLRKGGGAYAAGDRAMPPPNRRN